MTLTSFSRPKGTLKCQNMVSVQYLLNQLIDFDQTLYRYIDWRRGIVD